MSLIIEKVIHMRMRFLFLAALVLVFGFFDLALAQSAHPFATPEQRLSVPTSGWFAEFTGQMAAWQGQFYRQLTGAVRAWKQDGWAAWLLLGLSFGYGVFHALGPGHGKAVLTAYVLANKETIRNGALLAMLSAFLQALVAIALVAVAAGVLQVSGVAMSRATWWLELASYALMVALGAWLVFKHVFQSVLSSLGNRKSAHPANTQHAHAHHSHGEHACNHDHAHHPHTHHQHAHVHDENCGHVHMPDPALISGPMNWSKATSAILAVGLRPCTGAIFVLVFSLAQGFFIAGIAAALAMGLGTGLTVAALACSSLWISQVAVQSESASQRRWQKALMLILQALASVALLALGLLLLSAALSTGTTVN
jgi:ABC-type nickel/cobalt efflux system permease component RcnA